MARKVGFFQSPETDLNNDVMIFIEIDANKSRNLFYVLS